jgi:hypothetical protein
LNRRSFFEVGSMSSSPSGDGRDHAAVELLVGEGLERIGT